MADKTQTSRLKSNSDNGADEADENASSTILDSPPDELIDEDGAIEKNEFDDASVRNASADDNNIGDAGVEEESVENASVEDESATAIEDEQNPNVLDQVNIRIDFQIGEISMSAKQLASLAPGFTLTDLPHMIFPRARAMSGGRAFAEGELVDIDGKIGFRITKILP